MTFLSQLLDLEELDDDLFRGNTVFDEQYNLYGGQVAAQAVVAAGRTVSEDRVPHSLHGYFLRAGSASRPTIFQVTNDRDGGSFSARRVVALQHGEVIFSASLSFHRPPDGAPDQQDKTVASVPAPDEGRRIRLQRLFSYEGRSTPQPYAGQGSDEWPTRFWARCTEPELAKDPVLDAAVLTYLSDYSSALGVFSQDGWEPGPSLDHAIWFHRTGVTGDWLLSDYAPVRVTHGRGLYTGGFYDTEGRLVASIAQEALQRIPRV